jgi:hypothetical protein
VVRIASVFRVEGWSSEKQALLAVILAYSSTLIVEATRYSETLANCYRNTRRYEPRISLPFVFPVLWCFSSPAQLSCTLWTAAVIAPVGLLWLQVDSVKVFLSKRNVSMWVPQCFRKTHYLHLQHWKSPQIPRETAIVIHRLTVCWIRLWVAIQLQIVRFRTYCTSRFQDATIRLQGSEYQQQQRPVFWKHHSSLSRDLLQSI